MAKKDWYKIGLIFSIILYLLIFILAIVNYQARMDEMSIYGQHFHTISDIVIQRNIILALNPFWIGIVIFGVLLSKTKIGK
jgi:uncharacterized membrane protein